MWGAWEVPTAATHNVNVDTEFDCAGLERLGEVDACAESGLVDAGENCVEHELRAVHGTGAAVSGVHGGSHPVEVTGDASVDVGGDIGRLGRHGRASGGRGDRLRQIIGRFGPERVVNVREVRAVERVEVPIAGGVVLGTVPPVPVAALGDEQFFIRQLALRFGDLGRVLFVKVTGFGEIVPGAIIFFRA